jgi:energy-coupling factor transport system ATP-binding protein
LVKLGFFVSQIINFENVSFSYPREKEWALIDINISVEKGEFLAVMGENGAGKSTFCRLINGIIPHSIDGRLLGNVYTTQENTKELSAPQLAQKVGMVLDDPDAQLFTSSVRHEAAFGAENLLVPKEEIEKRIKFALSAVALGGFEDRSPSTLSGGEKQRLAIAAALAMSPEILVLDEPLARLDPQGAQEIMSLLRDIREKHQITVIMAVNSGGMIAGYADRICVLKKGRIIACGGTRDILENKVLLEDAGVDSGEPDIGSEEWGVGNGEDAAAAAAIKIESFAYSYGSETIIDNFNLCIYEGDFAALMGQNGCGKTTLLKSITGLLKPSCGDIFIRGKNIKELSVWEISGEAGFVMQNPDSQLFTDSVYNEVSFALKNAGLPKDEMEERVEKALNMTGLNDKDAFPAALSRAERTKIVIACVIAMGCKILIFDEVDVGQDCRGSRQIMEIAQNLNARGYTIIFVTHNMPLACRYAKRLIIMDRKGIISDKRR